MNKNTLIIPLVLLLFGCSTTWNADQPKNIALEETLLSDAVDRATANIVIKDANGVVINNLPQRLGKTMINAQHSGTNRELYAVHAIKRHFLDAGVSIVDSPEQADTIIDVSFGVIAVSNGKVLFGLPSFNLPIPAVGNVKTPEAALYGKNTYRGITKIALSVRDAKAGTPTGRSIVNYGISEINSWTIFFFFDVTDRDIESIKKQHEARKAEAKQEP